MKRLLLLVTLLLCKPAVAASPLLGTWQCQAASGPTQLVFRDERNLVYNGEASVYQVQGKVIWVLVDGVPAAYPYVLLDKRLSLSTPQGERIECGRGSPDVQDTAAGQAAGKLNHLLQGTLCSWSGSSSTGSRYSSSQRTSFDGAGHFRTGSESSFSSGSGGYYGQGPGNGGTYEVTAVQIGAPIRLRWANGETDVAWVHHVYGGRIVEVKYGKSVFGAGLCE